jgi:hypothetical protein
MPRWRTSVAFPVLTGQRSSALIRPVSFRVLHSLYVLVHAVGDTLFDASNICSRLVVPSAEEEKGGRARRLHPRPHFTEGVQRHDG